MRGTVHPVRLVSLVPTARNQLLADVELPMASVEDVYGSKLCAALDRKHPRHLFDVMKLYEHEGTTPGIRHDYEYNFQGMTEDPVPLDADERRFLPSLARAEPEWSLPGRTPRDLIGHTFTYRNALIVSGRPS